jgi:very-short-patch-repair endonuclease
MSMTDMNVPRRVRIVGGRDVFVAPGPPDRRIAALAESQRGRVARRQLFAAGLTPAEIRSRLGRGQLVVEHQGVYGVAPLLDMALGRETGALLACGPEARLCDWVAAGMWGLVAPPPPDRPIDITILGGGERGRRRTGIRIHRSAVLTAKDTTRLDALPIVTPQWALLEIAAHRTGREVERALDEGLAKRRLSRPQVRDLIGRVGLNRAGAQLLLDLVAGPRRLTITQNDKEEKVLPLTRAAGLADPVCQQSIGRYSIDFYWPEAKFGLEIDSMWHATRTNMRRDRIKDARLRNDGIELMRWMWEDIDADPIAFISHLVRQIERRLIEQRRLGQQEAA